MMASSSDKPIHETQTLNCPLLTERHDIVDNHVNLEHIVNIDEDVEEASSSNPSGLESSHTRAGTRSLRSPRNEATGRYDWTKLLTSSVYFSIELALTLTQTIASTTILCLSRHEHHPQALLLFAWVVGYTAGCFADLPATCWLFMHRHQGPRLVVCHNPYPTLVLRQSSEREGGRTMGIANSRVTMLSHYRNALQCFFAVWFVVGNVLIIGGYASVSDAPNLYRLCIVYLTLSWLSYSVIIILSAIFCCCLPSFLSVLGIGIREVIIPPGKGASNESINRLTTYKFKVKKDEQRNSEYGGIIAIRTENERVISAEDSVCCLCLTRYRGGDKLRELPCSHFFHAGCVDRWLKMKATCPLCKYEILENEEPPRSPPSNPTTWYMKIYYNMIDCVN